MEKTAVSTDPFKKVEAYLVILKEKSKSLQTQIAENDSNQSDLIANFNEIEASQKEEQLALINQNVKEKLRIQSELDWMKIFKINQNNAFTCFLKIMFKLKTM